MEPTRHIGILGFGKLGQFMVQRILNDGDRLGLKLAFVWNRSSLKGKVPAEVPVLEQLEQLSQLQVDLIVEVCHPDIVKAHGAFLLEHAHLLVGSSTALADQDCARKLHESALKSKHRLLIARGALWGANDIQRMARQNLLESVKVTMHFHPGSLRLEGSPLKAANDKLLSQAEGSSESRILYQGAVRDICHLAPNNVNTMATAALIGIGPDRTVGCLVADPNLTDHHKIIVEVTGIKRPGASKQFQAHCTRLSPTSNESSVSSTQTYDAFWQSILESLHISEGTSQIYVC